MSWHDLWRLTQSPISQLTSLVGSSTSTSNSSYKGSRRSMCCYKGMRISNCCYKGSRILKCFYKGSRISKCCCKGSGRSKFFYKVSRRLKCCCKGSGRMKCWCKGSRRSKCRCKGSRRSKCCYKVLEDRSVAAQGSSYWVLENMNTQWCSRWCSSNKYIEDIRVTIPVANVCWKISMTYRCITLILPKIIFLVTRIVYDVVISRIPFSLRGSVEIL